MMKYPSILLMLCLMALALTGCSGAVEQVVEQALKEVETVLKDSEESKQEPKAAVNYRLYAGKVDLFEGHGALIGISVNLLSGAPTLDSTPQNLDILYYTEDLYVQDILPFGEYETFTLNHSETGLSAEASVEIEVLPLGVQIKYDLSAEAVATEDNKVTTAGVYTGCTLKGASYPAVFVLEVEYRPGEGGRKRDVIIEIEDNISAGGTGKSEFKVLKAVHQISELSSPPVGPDFMAFEPVEKGKSVLIDGRTANESERFLVELTVIGSVFASAFSSPPAPEEFGEANGVLVIHIYDELSDEN